MKNVMWYNKQVNKKVDSTEWVKGNGLFARIRKIRRNGRTGTDKVCC